MLLRFDSTVKFGFLVRALKWSWIFKNVVIPFLFFFSRVLLVIKRNERRKGEKKKRAILFWQAALYSRGLCVPGASTLNEAK